MVPISPLDDVAHVIQLSIAPVFLLTAVGTFLGVLSTRLARIVDRSRVLHDRLPARADPAHGPVRRELDLLLRRRRLVNLAITFGVSAALLVCLLIATAFVGSILRARISVVLAALFVLAMIAFVVALVTFLREIFLAVASADVDLRSSADGAHS
jgi:Protein of unknown function (DUF2721)